MRIYVCFYFSLSVLFIFIVLFKGYIYFICNKKDNYAKATHNLFNNNEQKHFLVTFDRFTVEKARIKYSNV